MSSLTFEIYGNYSLQRGIFTTKLNEIQPPEIREELIQKSLNNQYVRQKFYSMIITVPDLGEFSGQYSVDVYMEKNDDSCDADVIFKPSWNSRIEFNSYSDAELFG